MISLFQKRPLVACIGAIFVFGLSACGGGSEGSAPPASSSGDIQTKAVQGSDAGKAASPASGTDDSTGSQNAGSTATRAGEQSASAAGQPVGAAEGAAGTAQAAAADTSQPATMEEPITARAVRGDVLATAVVQGASATRALAAPAEQISLQQWKDGGFAEKPTEPTVLYSEKLAAAANPGDALGPFTFDSRLWIDATRVPHSFDALRVRFGLSSGYPLATLPPGAAQDAEVLRVGRQLQAERQVMGQGRAYGEPQVKTATAASDTVIRRNARFPRNGEFVGWEGDKSDPNAVSVQWWLRVPFGDRNDRQFDLCMYVRGWGMAEGNDCGTCQVAKVERENCGQWEVPQNWHPGQPLTYRGQKLQETRERLRFDSDGNPYDYYRYYQDWKSGGPDRNAEDADVVPAKATAPLGEEGISGAALSAMLDGLSARARKQVNLPQYRDAVAAAPLGTRVPNAPEPARISQESRCDIASYEDHKDSGADGYSPALGPYTCRDYTQSLSRDANSPGSPADFYRRFVRVGVTAPVEADDFQGSHAVVLGKTVQATVSHLDASEVVQNLDLTLDAGKRMVLHDDALARFGVLREWRANENGQDRRVRLMVVQGKTEGTADLCWRVETPQVHRTSCSVWHIPAGWKRGQPLQLQDQYVEDARVHYPDESGMRYWEAVPADGVPVQADAAAATGTGTDGAAAAR